MKKTPEQKGKGAFTRMCAACGKKQHRDMMLRIVALPSGAMLCNEAPVSVKDVKTGKSSYICKDPACIAKAEKTHRPERLIGCVASKALYESIKEYMER